MEGGGLMQTPVLRTPGTARRVCYEVRYNGADTMATNNTRPLFACPNTPDGMHIVAVEGVAWVCVKCGMRGLPCGMGSYNG